MRIFGISFNVILYFSRSSFLSFSESFWCFGTRMFSCFSISCFPHKYEMSRTGLSLYFFVFGEKSTILNPRPYDLLHDRCRSVVKVICANQTALPAHEYQQAERIPSHLSKRPVFDVEKRNALAGTFKIIF